MKRLMSLLLSSTLCLSLAIPTAAFGAEESSIELDITDTNSDSDELEQNDNEVILENDKIEKTDNEPISIDDEIEEDNIILDSDDEEKNDNDIVLDSDKSEKDNDNVISGSDESEEDNNNIVLDSNEVKEDDNDIILDDNEVEEDNNEINSDDDMPVVSVTIDETGKLQDIDSDDGIMIEPVIKAEDEDVSNNEEINVSETEEETKEEELEKAAPIQGVLTDYYGTFIESFNGDEVNPKYIRENIDGAGSNMQKYTYYSKETHYNHEVIVNVRTDGAGLNERSSLSAGKFGFCPTHIEQVDPSNNAVLSRSVDYIITNLDPEEKQVRFECSVEPAQDTMKRVTRVFVIKLKGSEESGDSSVAPTSPEFIVDNDKTGLLLTGADSRMEYRKEETDTWIDCTDSDIAFAAPQANTNYYIRYKAQGDTPASSTKKIIAYARPAAPIFRINASTEKFSQAGGFVFDKTYEMKIDNGSYFDVTDEIIETGAAPFLDKVPAGTQQTLYIRKRATDVVPAGFERQITLLPRAATPTSLKYDKVNFQLTGVTSGMEYLNPTTSSWTSISKNIDLSSFATTENDVEIKVRVKQTTTNSASRPYVFIIPQLVPAPTWKIDYKNELLTGFTANQNYEWRKYGTTTWKTFKGSFVPLSELGYIGTGLNIYVRRQKTTTEPCSAAAYIKIPSRANKPTISFLCNDPRYKDDVVLKDIDNTMEYSLDLGKTWKDVTGTEMVTDFRSASYKIYFRYKATDTTFYSNTLLFTIGARGAAPTNYINTITEILNTTSSIEYSYDNINFSSCGGNMDMKAVIDAIPTGQTKNIYIRKMATEKNGYSLTKTITMYARGNAPTTPKYDSATQKINGMTTAMMYKSDTETAWHTISKGTSISVSSYIKNNPNATIEIRYKATATSSASKSLFIKL